jgi:hypothetical protein
MTTLGVPVSADLVGQIILRSEGRHDVATVVNNVLEDFLERTRGDADIWGEKHAEEVLDDSLQESLREYGERNKGLFWQNLFLPNRTQLRALPFGRPVVAEVKRQRLTYNGAEVSPSRFASMAWNNTSRNAWRDLWVKRPGDAEWTQALILRSGG